MTLQTNIGTAEATPCPVDRLAPGDAVDHGGKWRTVERVATAEGSIVIDYRGGAVATMAPGSHVLARLALAPVVVTR